MSRQRVTAVLMAAAIVTGLGTVGTGSAQIPDLIKRVPRPIVDQYIVTLKEQSPLRIPDLALQLAGRFNGRLLYTYSHALKGFSIKTSDLQAQALAAFPGVESVEQDGAVELTQTQTGATYGIDRIDQRSLPLNGTYTYTATGAGVKAYVIDTGIRFSHQEFGGRATSGFDAIDGGTADDCNGHGTHVAGSLGGLTYGVAKAVSIVGVRVLDCNGSGSNAGVIAGIDWVTGNHLPGQPAVANMSLGGGASATLDTAVRNSINDGITYAIAAGNGNQLGMAANACNSSPARVGEALTVSATDSTDKKASFANIGSCVDLFAPGVAILSGWFTSDTATNTISGTSMASPHVAGAAALYLQGDPSAPPATVMGAVNAKATTGKVVTPGTGSPNRLLYTGENAPPVADFVYSCALLACNFTDTSSDPDGNVASRSWSSGGSAFSTQPNPSRTFASPGTYSVGLAVTDNLGAVGSVTKDVTVNNTDPDPGAVTLLNAAAFSDSAGGVGTEKFYKILVPSGRPSLTVQLDGPACGLFGCSTNLNLYDRSGGRPTATLYSCRPLESDSDETCTHSGPTAQWWYLRVHVAKGGSAPYTIKATY